jgi:FAD:protein FMN transferase
VNVRRFTAMGCVVEVGGATAREAEAVERIFRARDRQFSRFRDDSELSRVNRTSREVVTVSKTFGQMVERALGAASATRGLVDPTLASALTAAGYDRDFEALEPRADAPRLGASGRWRAVRMVGACSCGPSGSSST